MPGILEHYERDEQTASTRSRHLLILRGSTKSELSRFSFYTRLHVHTGPGNRSDSLEWQEW